MNPKDRRSKFQFSISIGDVVTFLSILGSVSVLYFTLHEQVAILNVEVAQIKSDIQELRGEAIAYRERMKQDERSKR